MKKSFERDTFLNTKNDESEKEKKRKESAEKEEQKKDENESEVVDDLKRDEATLLDMMNVKEDEAEKVEPIDTDLPKIIDWMVVEFLELRREEMIKVIRADESTSFWKSFQDILKRLSRNDITDMYEVGKIKYDGKKFDKILTKIIWGWLQMMYEPEKFPFSFGTFKAAKQWRYFARSGVHQVFLDGGELIFMLTDRVYDMNLSLMRGLVRIKLITSVQNETAKNLLYMVMNQIHKKEKASKKKS